MLSQIYVPIAKMPHLHVLTLVLVFASLSLGCDREPKMCGRGYSEYMLRYQIESSCNNRQTSSAVAIENIRIETQQLRSQDFFADGFEDVEVLVGDVVLEEGEAFWSDSIFSLTRCSGGDSLAGLWDVDELAFGNLALQFQDDTITEGDEVYPTVRCTAALGTVTSNPRLDEMGVDKPCYGIRKSDQTEGRVDFWDGYFSGPEVCSFRVDLIP